MVPSSNDSSSSVAVTGLILEIRQRGGRGWGIVVI